MTTYLAFIKAHEKIIIALVFLVAAFFGTDLVLKHMDKTASAKVASDQSVSKSEAIMVSNLSAQLKEIQTDNAAQIAAFSVKIAQLQASASAKVKADSSATAPVVAKELGGIAPDPNTVQLPLDAARAAVEAVDMLPAVNQELKDTDAQLVAETSITDAQTALVVELQKQAAADKTTCNAQVAELKVASKRSWLKGFKLGFIGGFVSGIFVGHSA